MDRNIIGKIHKKCLGGIVDRVDSVYKSGKIAEIKTREKPEERHIHRLVLEDATIQFRNAPELIMEEKHSQKSEYRDR